MATTSDIDYGVLARQVVTWIRQNLPRALLMSAISFAAGWLFNVGMMAFRYQGFATSGSGGLATGQGTMVGGTLFWAAASTLGFSLFAYGRKVGFGRLRAEILSAPGILRESFAGDDRQRVWATLLWGAAVSVIAAIVIGPAAAGVVGVGLALVAGSPMARIVTGVVRRLWMGILARFAPGAGAPVGGIGGSVATTLGTAAGMLVASRFGGTTSKVVLGAICAGVAYYLVSQQAGPAGATSILFAFVAGLAIAEVFDAGSAFADDGGWAECGECSVTDWLRSRGAGEVLVRAGAGASAAGVGAPVGTAIGEILAGGGTGEGPGGPGGEPERPDRPDTPPGDGIDAGPEFAGTVSDTVLLEGAQANEVIGLQVGDTFVDADGNVVRITGFGPAVTDADGNTVLSVDVERPLPPPEPATPDLPPPPPGHEGPWPPPDATEPGADVDTIGGERAVPPRPDMPPPGSEGWIDTDGDGDPDTHVEVGEEVDPGQQQARTTRIEPFGPDHDDGVRDPNPEPVPGATATDAEGRPLVDPLTGDPLAVAEDGRVQLGDRWMDPDEAADLARTTEEWAAERAAGQQLVDEFKDLHRRMAEATDPAERAALLAELEAQAIRMSDGGEGYQARSILKAEGRNQFGEGFDRLISSINGDVDRGTAEGLRNRGVMRGGEPWRADQMWDVRNASSQGTVPTDRDIALDERAIRDLQTELRNHPTGSPEAQRIQAEIQRLTAENRITVNYDTYVDHVEQRLGEVAPGSPEAQSLQRELELVNRHAGSIKENYLRSLDERLADPSLTADQRAALQAERLAAETRVAGVETARMSTSQWNDLTQQVYNQNFTRRTGVDAGGAFQALTQRMNPEAYEDMAVLRNDPERVPFNPDNAEQTARVSGVKTTENHHLADEGLMTRGSALQEDARGYAKDITSKTIPLLASDPNVDPVKLDRLRRINETFAAIGRGEIPPHQIDEAFQRAVPEVDGMSMDRAMRIADANLEAGIKMRPPELAERAAVEQGHIRTLEDDVLRSQGLDPDRLSTADRAAAVSQHVDAETRAQIDTTAAARAGRDPFAAEQAVERARTAGQMEQQRVAAEAEAQRAAAEADALRSERIQSAFGRTMDLATVEQKVNELIAQGYTPAEATAVAIAETGAGNVAAASGVTDPRMIMAGGALLPPELQGMLPDRAVEGFARTGFEAAGAARDVVLDSVASGELNTEAIDRFAESVAERSGTDPFRGIADAAQLFGEESARTDGGSLVSDMERIIDTGVADEMLNESMNNLQQRAESGELGAPLEGINHIAATASDLAVDPSTTLGQFAQDVRNIATHGVGEGFYDEVVANTEDVLSRTPLASNVVQGYNEIATGLGESGVAGFAGEMAEGATIMAGEALEALGLEGATQYADAAGANIAYGVNAVGDAAAGAYDYLRSWF